MQANPATTRTSRLVAFLDDNWRGFLVSVVIAVAAQFLSEHYGAPAMLMALLLGIAFHFLAEEQAGEGGGTCKPGIEFTARTVLRFGVALLGARISAELMIGLGPHLIAVVVLGVVLTILFGLLGARMLNRGWRFGLLTGGSVAICGASAAMAISAVLPRNEHSERNLIFTVLSVTVLSTLAMILYPILTELFDFSDEVSGVFLGGTIHDVAQVVGAGFSVSDEVGEVATLVKLIRVAMLAPVVLVISVLVRRYAEDTATEGKRPPVLPAFVVGFLIFATLNSLGLIPAIVVEAMSGLSRWALLVSIAAVGMKTSLKRILDVGGQAIALIVAETVFIAIFVLAGVTLIAH
ncbi:YeiH family protein [Pukyongiella litopenaei]|uniref:YeiH family putative sulfate export transporter n=1 Tax=Pukyongiella litopenaei TaxID=2605946 RepID=A0A2S0MTD0_9RHOB|nr:YeiH family protein [Pukyongiella litopenaei]AVO39057.1 YeiH family putative sulfate export transporter [Pukyongiella litopenaei]